MNQTKSIFSGKRVLADFNDVSKNFAEDQVKELLFAATEPAKNSRVILYNLDPTHPLGKFFLELKRRNRAYNLETQTGDLETFISKTLEGFAGEVIHLSSEEISFRADKLKRQLQEAGINADTSYSFLYKGKEAGTLSVGLRDILNGELLKNQRREYMAKGPDGRIYVSDPEAAGLAGIQAALQAAVAYAAAA